MNSIEKNHRRTCSRISVMKSAGCQSSLRSDFQFRHPNIVGAVVADGGKRHDAGIEPGVADFGDAAHGFVRIVVPDFDFIDPRAMQFRQGIRLCADRRRALAVRRASR